MSYFEDENRAVREQYNPSVRRTTGVSRVADEHLIMHELFKHIDMQRKVSVMQVGVGMQQLEIDGQTTTCTYTPWYMFHLLRSLSREPKLTIVDCDKCVIDSLNSPMYAWEGTLRSLRCRVIWNVLATLSGTQEVQRGQLHMLPTYPHMLNSAPWVQVAHTDVIDMSLTPHDVVFARNVLYQMSEEAQLAFLQRMREEGLRKRSFLVINDFDSSSLPALLEENGGWLSRDDLRFLGYEINDDSLLQGAQIGTKEYTLRCV